MRAEKRIQQRIQQRRYGYGKTGGSPLFTAFYTLIIAFLIVASLTLAVLIEKRDGFTIITSQLNEAFQSLQLYRLSNWIPFENWFLKKETITTSLLTHYTPLKEHYFEALNQQAVSLDDGIVIYTAKQESGYLVIIKQDNGLLATYGTLSEIHVDENDRILKGEILGLTKEAIYLEFTYNGTAVDFQDALVFKG